MEFLTKICLSIFLSPTSIVKQFLILITCDTKCRCSFRNWRRLWRQCQAFYSLFQHLQDFVHWRTVVRNYLYAPQRGGDNYLLCCCLLLLSCCISKFHVFSVQNFTVTNVKESKSGLNYLVRPLYSTSFFSLPFPLTACQNYKCQLSVKYFQRFSRNKSGAMYLIVPVAAVRNSVAARRIQFSKSEIRNFRSEILSKKNDLWLDVKMQNLHFTAPMKIFNPTSHLKRNLIHFLPTQKGISFSRQKTFTERSIRHEAIHQRTL